MHFDPDLAQDAVGRVLHRALEGVARSVVAQVQSGPATNSIKGLIRAQRNTATFFASSSKFIAALTTGTFGTFSSSVRRRPGAAAAKHLHVNDVSVVGNSGKAQFAGYCQT